MLTRGEVNAFRYAGGDEGHYESYFQRANHPTRPFAFWIRYTAFVPRGWAGDAVGQLWAVVFDGERDEVRAVKEAVPMAACRFEKRALEVQIGEATLDARQLRGHADSGDTRIAWDLRYDSPEPPLLLLPPRMYRGGFPKAKALVGSPMAVFSGTLDVAGREIDVDGWVGSQNHNWGTKHTDRYAWGQVAGFDDAPDTFFECATASIKLGPVYTPRMSPMVLRHGGEEHRLNSLRTSLRAKAHYGFFTWHLSSASKHVSIEATFHARAQHFVALRYENPPGGLKTCLNTKLAACELILRRKGERTVLLKTRHRAAFEILTDEDNHGVRVLEE